MCAKFLQIHTLTSYPAALLNRDDVGFAKRISFGGTERVRISSQCLKRHWRTADHELGLERIELDGETVSMAVRSRRTFEEHIYKPLLADGVAEEVATAVTEELRRTVLPPGEGQQEPSSQSQDNPLRTSQVTVLGHPEVRYLRALAQEAVSGVEDAEGARQAWADLLKDRDLKGNLRELAWGAGVDAALFGRMVTGDVLARCHAAIHVSHAFTVDKGAFETDYFSAVDDLQPQEETGSAHINTAELTTGLFYGYVVVDVPLLVSNLEGCDRKEWENADRRLAAEVVRRLIHLAATVSPGAKLGPTAPHARALTVLAETGETQPRTLANAFLNAVKGHDDLLEKAQRQLATHLEKLDEMYGRETKRRLAAVTAPDSLTALVEDRLDLPSLAEWAAETIREAA